MSHAQGTDMPTNNSDDTLRPSNAPSSTPETTIREHPIKSWITYLYYCDNKDPEAAELVINQYCDEFLKLYTRLITEARPEKLVIETYEKNGETIIADNHVDYKMGHSDALTEYETNLRKKLQ